MRALVGRSRTDEPASAVDRALMSAAGTLNQRPAGPHAAARVFAGYFGVRAKATAFVGASPFKPPPHLKPGMIRIPHGRGGFGEAAKNLANQKKLLPKAPKVKRFVYL